MQNVLRGLVAAPFTPLLPNGDLNLASVHLQAQGLAQNRVNGAFVCGTTGEGMSLTMEERRAVAEEWRRMAPSGLSVIVHVGHAALRESCVLADHAARIGVDAIGAMAPCFFKPDNAEMLVEWCAQIAGAASELPFYYYHMPSMNGVHIPVAKFLNAVGDRIPNLAGVKFTDEDLIDYSESTEVAGVESMLFGRDEILLSGLTLGAAGAVGSTYNYAAPLFHQLIAAFEVGDSRTARAKQAEARRFIRVINRFGGLPAGKAVMGMIGCDCGPVREPLRPLDQASKARLRDALDEIGFFDYASRCDFAAV